MNIQISARTLAHSLSAFVTSCAQVSLVHGGRLSIGSHCYKIGFVNQERKMLFNFFHQENTGCCWDRHKLDNIIKKLR